MRLDLSPAFVCIGKAFGYISGFEKNHIINLMHMFKMLKLNLVYTMTVTCNINKIRLLNTSLILDVLTL